MDKMERKIIMFYGEECVHCHTMMPIIDEIEKEVKGRIKFDRREVWHNKKNQKLMDIFKKEIKEACSGGLGVPVFIDDKNKKAFCGEAPYEEFKKWLTKKK